VVLAVDPMRNGPWDYEIEREILRRAGVDLVVPATDADADAWLDRCDVVASTGRRPLTAEVIATLRHCAGIVCYSAGRNAVDEEAAAAAGIAVAGVHAAADDVADHAMLLVLAAARRLVPLARAADDGVWDYRRYPEIWSLPRLRGRTLGVVGAGHVGRAVAVRARAFGMATVATHHHRPAAPDAELPHLGLHDLFAASDVVVLTAALTPQTAGMIDASVLAAARPGLVLVNVARGGLIVEDDLADALDAGRVGAAGLDVRASEPPDAATDRLGGRADVVQTPHVGAASEHAIDDLHTSAAETAIDLLCAAGRLDTRHPTPRRAP